MRRKVDLLGRVVKAVNPLNLKSNAVAVRRGFDGSEPQEVSQFLGNGEARGWRRFSIAINTFYPELAGGYYENVAIVLLLQNVMADAGLGVANEELLEDRAITPDELFGAIRQREKYAVIKDSMIVGRCLLWSFDAGGGSDYYRDALVFDLMINEAIGNQIFEDIRNQCLLHRVRYEQDNGASKGCSSLE